MENSAEEKSSNFESVGMNDNGEMQRENETKDDAPVNHKEMGNSSAVVLDNGEEKISNVNVNAELQEEKAVVHEEEQLHLAKDTEPLNASENASEPVVGQDEDSGNGREGNESPEESKHGENEVAEPEKEGSGSSTNHSPNQELDAQGTWPESLVRVRDSSVFAVARFLSRLSGKKDDEQVSQGEGHENGKNDVSSKEVTPVSNETEQEESSQQNRAASRWSALKLIGLETEQEESSEKNRAASGWNALKFIGIFSDDSADTDVGEKEKAAEKAIQPIAMKGRILLYTRLGCNECKQLRKFLYNKRLRYIEINVDLYPIRKLELEKITGSSAVPKVFFNEMLIGGLSETQSLDETGKLEEKIEYVLREAPPNEAPLPPLSGEDDLSTSGSMDELAIIVRKMKDSIAVKDRFYRMRRFTKCFLGSEAVDFLSEDQYLEREEAIEFGRKLASKLFIHHVLDENLFEDGYHLYYFLDDDPFVSQCRNIPRGIIDVKPKPIEEISSRLRFLCYAVFEAYASEDGRHVDYRTIHGSEEFARYLRIVEELQRVDMYNMSREEKLSFFINLYNMMTIHAILVLGHPIGALQRRRLFGDFRYVIGGCTYSLSDIQNGILRGNQRPPYNLTKPFGAKDNRSKVALPYPEPLIHFALVGGTRSCPALYCYSPGNIDEELMNAARNFLRSGLIIDIHAKIAYVSKILKWYSVDFGKNEVEVLKHAANYSEPAESQALLELLSNTQLKVIYQDYDWGLNI